jgi:hypothetical protein
MSVMSELAYDIEQLYIEGKNAGQIARELDCPKELVLGWIAEQGCKPFDEWDESAQERLIKDIYSPFDTVNS